VPADGRVASGEPARNTQQQRSDAMRAIAIALSTLLLGGALLNAQGAQAAKTQHYPLTAAKMPAGVIRLAESNQKSPNKLADKYLAGQAGGRYGIGGTEHDKAKGGKSKSKSQRGGNAQGQKPPVQQQQ
jgi:hypothetical protein